MNAIIAANASATTRIFSVGFRGLGSGAGGFVVCESMTGEGSGAETSAATFSSNGFGRRPLVFRKTGSGIFHISGFGFGAVVLNSSSACTALFASSFITLLLLQIENIRTGDDAGDPLEILDQQGRRLLKLYLDLAEARVHLDHREAFVHDVADRRFDQIAVV